MYDKNILLYLRIPSTKNNSRVAYIVILTVINQFRYVCYSAMFVIQ